MYATQVFATVEHKDYIYWLARHIIHCFMLCFCHIDLQIEVLKDELETAKEVAQRAPSKTMKHLVERLRNQLALKEKQQKVDLKCQDCPEILLQKSSFRVCGRFNNSFMMYVCMMYYVLSAVAESSSSAAQS